MTTLANLLNGTAILYDADGGGAGGGDAGAGGDNGAGADGGNAGGGAWYDSFENADHKAWVQAQNIATPEQLVNDYRNMQKLTGDLNSVIKLPKEMTPETMRPVFERLGAGKTPDDYKLPVPDGESGDFAKVAAGWMHEAGVTVDQAKMLAEKWNEHVGGLKTSAGTEMKQRDDAQLAQLKADWGQNMQANTAIVDRAAEAFGMTPEQLGALRQTMGPGEAMKFLLNIGSKMGVESGLVTGDGQNSFAQGGSPAVAQQRISELRRDTDFVRKYNSGDVAARREMERLHRIAYPES